MKNKNRSSKRHTTAQNDGQRKLGGNLRAIMFGVLSALLSLPLLSLILSFAALLCDDPNKLIFTLSTVALCISSVIGGFIAAKRSSLSLFTSGGLVGIILLGIYLLFSLSFKSPTASTFRHILCFRISVPISSVLGAYLTSKRSYKKKHKR